MCGRLQQVSAPEALGMVVGRRPHHAGVAVAPRPTEVLVVAHAEQRQRLRQFDSTMGT